MGIRHVTEFFTQTPYINNATIHTAVKSGDVNWVPRLASLQSIVLVNNSYLSELIFRCGLFKVLIMTNFITDLFLNIFIKELRWHSAPRFSKVTVSLSISLCD